MNLNTRFDNNSLDETHDRMFWEASFIKPPKHDLAN